MIQRTCHGLGGSLKPSISKEASTSRPTTDLCLWTLTERKSQICRPTWSHPKTRCRNGPHARPAHVLGLPTMPTLCTLPTPYILGHLAHPRRMQRSYTDADILRHNLAHGKAQEELELRMTGNSTFPKSDTELPPTPDEATLKLVEAFTSLSAGSPAAQLSAGGMFSIIIEAVGEHLDRTSAAAGTDPLMFENKITLPFGERAQTAIALSELPQIGPPIPGFIVFTAHKLQVVCEALTDIEMCQLACIPHACRVCASQMVQPSLAGAAHGPQSQQ